MSSTHRHLLLDFFWQVISGPPCITGKGVYNYLNMYINFPGYIPNLTSVKDNLKIYIKLMFFKTLPKRTRNMLFNIRALSVFRYSACFAALD
jgi:hypothetical protein